MKAEKIAKLVGGTALPHGERELLRVSGFEGAGPDAVVFATDAAAVAAAVRSEAGLIFVRQDAECDDARAMRVRDPKYAFALVGKALAPAAAGLLLHSAAHIDAAAMLGEGTRVGAGAVVEANVVVGKDCVIGSNAILCRGTHLRGGDRAVRERSDCFLR